MNIFNIIMCLLLISCAGVSDTPVLHNENSYTDDDLFCLAAVIYNEAGGDACTDEQRTLVGEVVLNRVNDSRFPDTIREVIEQKGQYTGMSKGVKFASRAKNVNEKHAVERAYDTAKQVLENEPMSPSDVIFQSQVELGSKTYKKIGNTYFCHG